MKIIMELKMQLLGLDVDFRVMRGERALCRYMKGECWQDDYDFAALRQIVSRFAHSILPPNYFFSTFYDDNGKDAKGKDAKGLLFSIENLEEGSDAKDLLKETNSLVEKSYNMLINGTELTSIELTIPNEFKIPCKQYLQYFPQFMLDQGVDIQITVEDINSSTWITIIPNDEEYPSDNLIAGLNNYIGLVNIPRNKFPNVRHDIAFNQLLANVSHLQNQVLILTNRLDDKSKSVVNTETLFTEAIQIKEYDGKYFKIDLPSILRKIKRKLTKG